MSGEEIKITIVVDDNLSADIKLKRQMSAIEFYGITQKAKQLFNISNKEMIIETTNRECSPITNSVKNYSAVEPRQDGRTIGKIFTPEKLQMLKENYGKIPNKELAKKLGVKIPTMIYRVRTMDLQKKHGKRPRKTFSEQEQAELIDLYNTGMPASEICQHFNAVGLVQTRRIYDKITALRKKGILK
jgi:hypothetical protein